MGLCLTTMCAAEAPVFHFSGPLFDAVGLPVVLHAVMGAYVLRLCLYASLSFIGSPWAVLPIEVLHGLTFGCAWAAGTLNCSRIAPKGLEATTQALFNVSCPLSCQHASMSSTRLSSQIQIVVLVQPATEQH